MQTLVGGKKLGPYEILAPLGAGGMGEVYRANDTRLDRIVAIKVLPEHLRNNPDLKARFEREARAISQLTHPHICTLYDVGHHEGTDYLVMEYLEGQTLADRLSKGPLPLDQVLKIGVEMASALDKAHRSGVVHRDLKPGNIMLTKAGAKLLDFGLAKSAGLGDATGLTITKPLTSAGTLLGTFQYMSPEQLEGREADARTDLFAFGAVFYEMTTGKRAFDGKSRASLISSIMTAQPAPISALQPMTPPALDRLVRKCLAKDPDERWQSAADVADELRWISEGGSQIGASHMPRSRTRALAALGWIAAAILGMLAVAAWLLSDAKTAARSLHLSVALPGTDVVEAYERFENLAIAISPDGESLAYCARGADGFNLYHRRLDVREPTRIGGTEGAYNPFFSPDSQWIGFFSGSKLRKVSIHGGTSIPLADVMESRGGIWLNESTIVFSPAFTSALMRVSSAGGMVRPVTTLNVERGERTHRWPEVLPGGEWILFSVGTVNNPEEYDECTIEAVSIKTGERRVLIQDGRMARYAPPGYLVFAKNNVLFAAPLDPRDPRITTSPLPVLDNVSGQDASGASNFSVSLNGTLAYVPTALEELDEPVWGDMTGKIEPIGIPLRAYECVRASRDGTQLLLGSGAGGQGEAWLYTLATGRLTRIAFDQKCTDPIWMPDQRHIVIRTDKGGYKIKIAPIDGSEAPRVIHSDADAVTISGITPDGASLLFAGGALPEVFIVPTDGSAPARPLWEQSGSQFAGAVSPDGRWLAYTSNETGANEVFVRPSSGQMPKWQISTDGGAKPLWAPGSKELYFVRENMLMGASIEVRDAQVTPGIPRKLFELPPARHIERDTPGFDIMPDGKRFILLRTAAPGLGRRHINVVLNWSWELEQRMPRERNSR